jgi:hypothetical protein
LKVVENPRISGKGMPMVWAIPLPPELLPQYRMVFVRLSESQKNIEQDRKSEKSVADVNKKGCGSLLAFSMSNPKAAADHDQ